MLNFHAQSESINSITKNLKKNTKTSLDIPSYQFEKIKEEEEEKTSKIQPENNESNLNLNSDDLDECAAQLFEMKNNQQILPYPNKK